MTENKRCYSYIRFSTPDQIRGDSLRRQLERTKEYAEQNNLFLDESLTIKDIGVSGYQGKNKQKGNLKIFLDAIDDGKIESGSVLVIESFDRLSRDNVIDSFSLFTSIINADIKIVTLIDGNEYTRESVSQNVGLLYSSLGSMLLANEESSKKSYRIRKSWEEKRKNISNKKLTSICPAWLELNAGKTEFVKNKDRCAVVRRIFDLCEDGVGANLTAKILNLEGVDSWKKDSGWYSSYVSKILASKAVYGEYQPHKMVDGKRKPEGDPIENYFPKIVEQSQFRRAQEKLKERKMVGSGRVGNARNLFTGIGKCAYCGSSMAFVNKGKGSKGGTYLACDRARRGMGCEYHGMRYPAFEKAFLVFCRHLNLSDVLMDEKERSDELDSLRKKIRENENLETELKGELDNYFDAIAHAKEVFIVQKLTEKAEAVNRKITDLAQALESDRRSLSGKELMEQRVEKTIDEISELYSKIEGNDTVEQITTRLRLRNKIKEIVSEVSISPAGRVFTKELLRKRLDLPRLEPMTDQEFEEEWSDYVQISSKSKKGAKEFSIRFKNGNLITVVENEETGLYEKRYDKDNDNIMMNSKEWSISINLNN